MLPPPLEPLIVVNVELTVNVLVGASERFVVTHTTFLFDVVYDFEIDYNYFN